MQEYGGYFIQTTANLNNENSETVKKESKEYTKR